MPELLLGNPGQGAEGWELQVARRKAAVHSYAEQGTLSKPHCLRECHNAKVTGDSMCPIATSQLRCKTFHSGPNAVSHRVPVPIPMSQERKQTRRS